jgi:hypothetical protein
MDGMTSSGSDESKSHYISIADRGRTEAETGVAHMYGYADPNEYRDELSRMPNSTTGAFRSGHTTETGPGKSYVRAGQDEYYGRNGRMDGGVEREVGGYGRDDGRGRPGGAQGFEQPPPAIDGNKQGDPGVTDGRDGLHPTRTPQNTEAGWTSMSQAGSLTPAQQRMKRDFPPELPSRSQAQTVDDNRHGHIYQ